jgi:hypothetical protein
LTTDPEIQMAKQKQVLKYSADASVELEIQISDPDYEVAGLENDFKYERAWVEGKTDKDGWRKLVYSADGQTGNPWQIGKIRVIVSKLSNVSGS